MTRCEWAPVRAGICRKTPDVHFTVPGLDQDSGLSLVPVGDSHLCWAENSCSLQLPGDIKLAYFDAESNMQEISIEQLTKGKKVSLHFTNSWLSLLTPDAYSNVQLLLSAASDSAACLLNE